MMNTARACLVLRAIKPTINQRPNLRIDFSLSSSAFSSQVSIYPVTGSCFHTGRFCPSNQASKQPQALFNGRRSGPVESAVQRFASTAPAPSEADVDTTDGTEPSSDAEQSEKKFNGVQEYDPKDRTRLVTWETSVRYMKSEAYQTTYGNDPVWKNYRRQHKGQIPRKDTRKSCLFMGRISIGSPCPACRDEYLVFDYRHPELLKQFISPHTGERLNLHVIGLCQKKRHRLDVELEKARHFGTMTFKVPSRRYDYADYYGESVAPKIAVGNDNQ